MHGSASFLQLSLMENMILPNYNEWETGLKECGFYCFYVVFPSPFLHSPIP